MIRLYFLLAVLLATFAAPGQPVVRQPGEAAADFAARVRPADLALTQEVGVIETAALDPTRPPVLVACYRRAVSDTEAMGAFPEDQELRVVVLWQPIGSDRYERRLVDTLSPEGAAPELVDFFLVNADQDPARELAVLVRYNQRHYDMDGLLYETHIYDYAAGVVRRIDALSARFSGCDCAWRDGKTRRARYKTAAAVRKGLRRMGYPQQ